MPATRFQIPVIETERLVLRGWAEAEFARMAEIFADPVVGRFIGGAHTRGASWDSFLRNFGTWALCGFGMWAVESRSSGRVLGQLGFARRLRGLGTAFETAPEAGWSLAPEAHGRGIGHEAMAAALGWFDAQSFGTRSHAVIDVQNAASLRLAERLGYRRRGKAELAGDPVIIFARDRAA